MRCSLNSSDFPVPASARTTTRGICSSSDHPGCESRDHSY
jgi:hypothetical protein